MVVSGIANNWLDKAEWLRACPIVSVPTISSSQCARARSTCIYTQTYTRRHVQYANNICTYKSSYVQGMHVHSTPRDADAGRVPAKVLGLVQRNIQYTVYSTTCVADRSLGQRPISHTCCCELQLSTCYRTYIEFAKEFYSILRSSDAWEMHAVWHKLSLLYNITLCF